MGKSVTPGSCVFRGSCRVGGAVCLPSRGSPACSVAVVCRQQQPELCLFQVLAAQDPPAVPGRIPGGLEVHAGGGRGYRRGPVHPGQPYLHGVCAPARLGHLVSAVSPEAVVGQAVCVCVCACAHVPCVCVCVCVYVYTGSFSSQRADCPIAGAVGVGGAVPWLQFIHPNSLDLQSHEPPSLPSPRVTSKATSHTSTRSWLSASRTLFPRCPRCADSPARGRGQADPGPPPARSTCSAAEPLGSHPRNDVAGILAHECPRHKGLGPTLSAAASAGQAAGDTSQRPPHLPGSCCLLLKRTVCESVFVTFY